MKETIVTVTMPPMATNIPQTKWQSDALIATFGKSKWKPIVADGVFALASDVGTFILDAKGFASRMMCDKALWQNDYKQGFQTIVNAIAQPVSITEQEVNVQQRK